MLGLFAGVGFVVALLTLNYSFVSKPPKLFFIDTGYRVVAYAAMGSVLSGWQ